MLTVNKPVRLGEVTHPVDPMSSVIRHGLSETVGISIIVIVLSLDTTLGLQKQFYNGLSEAVGISITGRIVSRHNSGATEK